MIVAHLSDLHIRPQDAPRAFGRIDTNEHARRAFRKVMTHEPRPDLLIITGDLTDCGRIEEYEILREMLKDITVPVHLVVGNHDIRENFRQVFPEHTSSDGNHPFIQFARDHFPLRVLGLDTVVEGEGRGGLCPQRLHWLRQQLARSPRTPTLLVMHHGPFRVGNAFLDSVRLVDGACELKEVVEANPQIVRILCGHHHRSIDCVWGGVLTTVGPAIANALHFELGPSRSVRAIAEPPAFKMHVWLPEEGLVSHTVFLGDFGEPFEAVPDPAYPAMRSFQQLIQ